MLLSQQRRFEALDFSYHILKVNRVDMKDENVKGIVSSQCKNWAVRFNANFNNISVIWGRKPENPEKNH
jgi:cytoplasmic FMR1 interacting protein